MKKTPTQKAKTIVRNITLVIESFNSMPRWLAFVRLMLSIPLSAGMIWVGFFTEGEGGVFTAIGSLGILVLLGSALMVAGGILSANFWRKLERMRRASACQPANQ